MAVGVGSGGDAIAAYELVEQLEISVGILLGAKDAPEHAARRVVDGGMQDEARPAVFEPGMMTAIDLDKEPGLRHGLAAAPMARRTPFPGTGQTVLPEEALDRRARDLDAFAVLERFGEVTVVEASIGRTGQGQDVGASSGVQLIHRLTASVPMGECGEAAFLDLRA